MFLFFALNCNRLRLSRDLEGDKMFQNIFPFDDHCLHHLPRALNDDTSVGNNERYVFF